MVGLDLGNMEINLIDTWNKILEDMLKIYKYVKSPRYKLEEARTQRHEETKKETANTLVPEFSGDVLEKAR